MNMPKPLIKQLGSKESCEHMLECLYGLNQVDIECYKYVVKHKNIENELLADVMNKDQSTTNRSLSRLIEQDLVEKKTVTYEQGGYKYIYNSIDPSIVANRMKKQMAEWLSDSYDLVDEYEEKYESISE
jgi:predicted transcriptional regulator